MIKFQITKLDISYVEQVKNIFDLQFGTGYFNFEQLKTVIYDKDSLCMIALKEGEVIGVSITLLGSAEKIADNILKKKNWFIKKFDKKKCIALRTDTAVKPGYEGKGVGSRLLKEGVQLLEKSCDAVISIIWKEGNSLVMNRLMEKNQFELVLTISKYWDEDSIEKAYICPKCQTVLCKCSALFYVKKIKNQ